MHDYQKVLTYYFFANMVAIVGAFLNLVICWIPILGVVVAVIFSFVEIIMIIPGWLNISKAEIEVVPEI